MSLNSYPIIKKLGEGGFGTTYLATNTLMPSQAYCVVKQLTPTSTEPKLQQLIRDRFKQEAITLENLGKNSNGTIPSLYAYFIEQGEFYLVQEYINGQTLSERVATQGLFTELQVKQFLTDILPVLTYVHQRGIVHRDIKPDNIMIRQSDNKPILIDFGAVKETMSTMMTASGNMGQSIVIGTPGFMPIEQMSGRPMFASDIYALGLTAIYLLTGKLPAEFTTDPHTGNINWQLLAPNVSPQLKQLLDKTIQPVSNYRYQNTQDILRDLGSHGGQASPDASTTVVSPIPTNYSPQVHVPHQNQTNNIITERGSNDSTKTIVIGAAIASVLLIAGLLLGKNLQQADRKPSSSDAVATASPVVTESKTPENPHKSSPQPSNTPAPAMKSSSQQSSEVHRLGWMRLGSVSSRDGNMAVGQQLIRSTQPIIISPARVPSIGDRVVTVNPVNIRLSSPQPPNYALPEKTQAIPPGQSLTILNTNAFVDPTSPSPYTAVWAEVGITKNN
jgi:serine/threonine protein kinase, bacterial